MGCRIGSSGPPRVSQLCLALIARLSRVVGEPEGGYMTKVSQKKKRWPRWAWPLGLLAAGAGGAATLLLRGCWHTKMGWPARERDHSYQVALDAGSSACLTRRNSAATD